MIVSLLEVCNRRPIYFNLQQVIATKTLVVHLMISIIRITTALILHKRKSGCRSAGRLGIRLGAAPTIGSMHYGVLVCRNGLDDRNFRGTMLGLVR